jgi:YVTN family beta-propeller protein
VPGPGHPGAVAAGPESLWLALTDDKLPVQNRPLLQLDLASGELRSVLVGGQATHLLHAGDRLLASVDHDGSTGSGPSLVVTLDWRSGRQLASVQYHEPIGPLAVAGQDLWVLRTRPAALLRLDSQTLTPKAAPLELSSGRGLGLAVGAGYVWATAADSGEVLRIDPDGGKITRRRVGGFPVGIVVAGGSVWFADRDDGAIIRLAPRTLRRVGEPIRVEAEPSWLATAGGYLFVGNANRGTVARIDVRSGKKVGAPIRFAESAEAAPAFAIARSGPSVWVSSIAGNTLTHISSAAVSAKPTVNTLPSAEKASTISGALPRGGKVVAEIAIPPGFGGFAVGEGAVWVTRDAESKLLRIDPKQNAIVDKINVDRSGAVAVGAGAVWVSHPDENTVSRIDPKTNEVSETIAVGKQPDGIAVSPSAVWVANAGAASVSRIDPTTNSVVRTIKVGPALAAGSEHMGVTAAGGAIWVAVPKLNRLVRIDPVTNALSGTVELPYSPCAFLDADESAVWSAGGGCADVVARIDAHTLKPTAKVYEPHPVGLALAFDTVWVAVLGSGNVDQYDPRTGRLVARLPVGGPLVQLAAAFGSVWVVDDDGRILRIKPDR